MTKKKKSHVKPWILPNLKDTFFPVIRMKFFGSGSYKDEEKK
jgi:hypothetical protein